MSMIKMSGQHARAKRQALEHEMTAGQRRPISSCPMTGASLACADGWSMTASTIPPETAIWH
jgi:hypothetical protein